MIGSIKNSLYTFLFRFDEAMFEKHHDIDRISKEYASEQIELEDIENELGNFTNFFLQIFF